ncbi:MAG: cystathionine beta-synthase [Candidatus Eremiobacteraeota bacterium]|nr:cystathionine beta-synthase [Candidatus Eremiobacteraeota bacterium]MBV9056385.1 cystathionine beta-synthase [Candidatus Eremiobacteraeota bacterium]MBV9700868.1 cystathionine beta-synthase [Candidatus Eremiobacteraeota bacterium]
MATTAPSSRASGLTYYENALAAIGRTPLIKLNKVVDDAACLVLAKVEYVNPGGSVKDRPALAMLEAAEREGLLKPGGTIVEPTSGNTGTGLAMAAAIRGYRCILVMPDKMSREKIDLLRAYGADVVITPTNVPADSPESYYGVANRLASEIPGAFQPNQFHNHFNPEAHYRTTGPEIWEQTGGAITHFVAGIGTGGTISGSARFLKEQNPQIHVIGADPEGSIYSGDIPRSYAVEGIGMSYLPETVDLRVIDEMVRVSDRDSFLMARRITREEGLLVGGSSGTAAVAAARLAKTLPPEAVVVVILPDSGRGYMSKIFNDDWMIANGFLADSKRRATVGDVLRSKTPVPPLITVQQDDTVKTALDLLREYEISQLPVMHGRELVGSVNDVGVMQSVFDHADIIHEPVSEIMGRPFPALEQSEEIDRAYKLLTLANPAIVVTDDGEPIGVLTRQDIITFLSTSSDVVRK